MARVRKPAGTTNPTDTPFGFPRRAKLPVTSKFPTFPRGPAELASALAKPQLASGPGLPPADLIARLGGAPITKPEWYVYWALGRLGKVPDIDFQYRGEVRQSFSLSLKSQLDFTMLDGSLIAMEVQGTHWHYEMGAEKVAEDQFRRLLIAAQGYTVIFMDEEPLVSDESGQAAIWLVTEALAGRDHSYQTNPYTFNL